MELSFILTCIVLFTLAFFVTSFVLPFIIKIAFKLHNLLNGIIFIGCGGALDVLGGKEKRPHVIIGDNHLEWLYRFIRNPKRITSLKIVSKYLFHIIIAWLKGKNYSV